MFHFWRQRPGSASVVPFSKKAPGWGWMICGRNDVWFGEPPPEAFPAEHEFQWEKAGLLRVTSATFGAYFYLASRACAVHLLNCLVPLRYPHRREHPMAQRGRGLSGRLGGGPHRAGNSFVD